MVTKVEQQDPEGGNLHQQHFQQTVNALKIIRDRIRVVEEEEMHDLIVNLPPPNDPQNRKYTQKLIITEKKLCIFDMDETLIHCVDDIETQEPDVVLEINFEAEEETVYAGINIRPYIIECLEEAAQNF